MKHEQPLMEQFIHALQQVNRYLRSSAFASFRSQLTRVQWLLLRNLQREGMRTIGELADHLNVRQSTMSQMVDRLEKSNFVERLNHASDARIRLVQLTPAGRTLIEQTEKIWLEVLSQPFKQLEQTEQLLLVQLMEKLTSAIPRKDEET
jgi:DNA-binding MarR family transcriptional regulator